MSTPPTPDEATLDVHRERLQHIAAVRDSEPAAALAALRAGMKQVDVASALGRTREHIRRITRRAAEAEAEAEAAGD